MSNENNDTNTQEEYNLYNEENLNIMFLELSIRYLENIRFTNILFDHIDDLTFEDDLNRVMRESLEADKQLVRNDEFIDFKKIKYCNIDDKDKTSDNTICSICLTVFEDECDVSLTNCNHLFHTDCIKEWSRYKKDCPICRCNLKNKIEKDIK